MTEYNCGSINLPDKIDITDPCYDKDVWCRINNFPIAPGKYKCYAQTLDNEEPEGWGTRVSRIGIRRDKAEYYEFKGSIGVDAGLAGFFVNKPDYTDEEWAEFCGNLDTSKVVYLTEDSFFSDSGYGDGSYSVYAGYKNGEIVEVYIEFIGEDNA